MPFSDDKFGTIWPVRDGLALGGARERQMLDAIGGSEGFRTRLSYNPDGSVTEMRTKNGMPQFTTTMAAPKIVGVVPGNSVFFCTPSSTIYQSGYTPSGAPGPVSRWMDWDTAVSIPNAHGGAVPVLTAFAAYETGAGGAAKVSPGNITWYGNVKDANNTPIVISWHGGGIRAGRYDKVNWSGGSMVKTRSKISLWNYFPSCTTGFQLKSEVPSDASPAAMETYPWLWVGGKARVRVQASGSDLPIHAAGLRSVGGGHELVVISGDAVYAGAIALLVSGALSDALDNTVVSVAHVCNVPLSATYALLQWPFMNASATKAAYLVNTYTNTAGSRNPLYEVDLISGAATVVSAAECKEVYQPAYSTVGTDTNSSVTSNPDTYHAEIHTSSNFSGVNYSGVRVYYEILAADYVSDTLVYLTAETGTLGAGTTSNQTRQYDFVRASTDTSIAWSASVNNAFSVASTGGFLKTRLVHSTLGEVFSEQYGAVGGSAYTASGTVVGSIVSTSASVALEAPFSTTRSEDQATGEIALRLYNADLRNNAYLIAVSGVVTRSVATRNCAGKWVMFDPQYGSANYYVVESNTTTSQVSYMYPLHVVAKVGGQVVFEASGALYEETIPAVTTWVDPNVPYQSGDIGWSFVSFGASPSVPAAEVYAREVPFAYPPNLPANVESCPKVAHMAVSHDKKGVYAGYASETSLFTRPPSKEAFMLNNTITAIPANRYCPGSEDTLASPVFFPAY